ncbi:MAG TPA: DUF420 domain-containing protein [Terriglobales bacterium]|nr:DUF420 domain-containing protein [Terriglobales bacterium]
MIGGVILDQPAGGGIGAATRGASSLRSREVRIWACRPASISYGDTNPIAPSWRGWFERHKKIARWTLPLWFYVSVTGVVVYWMLYHLHL